MKQILLGGDGQVQLADMPVPARLRDSILVANAFSAISAGTEGSAVARHAGLFGTLEKISKHRDKMGQVWQMARKQGFQATAGLVSERLKGVTPLGYSSAGIVVESDHAGMPFSPGDRVACMGTGFATHSEYAVVPRNLVARVPDGVSLEDASFGALGCIALQAIRRLDLTPGECVGVIGLGLIGQLCARLLRALGYFVVALDLDESRVEFARKTAHVEAWSPTDRDPERAAAEITEGRGLDGVVVAAASSSSEPLGLACRLCRPRGRVSIVGDVGLELKRSEIYRKELDVRISCSYGPGRYNEAYELHGQDYPLAHVRWTENRNLQLFLQLLDDKRLEVATLLSRTFAVDDFHAAYQAVKAPAPNQYGILFDYHLSEDSFRRPVERKVLHGQEAAAPSRAGVLRLGLIGVGGYATNVHVPIIKGLSGKARIAALASRTGTNATRLAKSLDCDYSTTDYTEILQDPEIDAVLIATRHSLHAEMVIQALEAEKHVFVEKPLAVSMQECARIMEAARESPQILQVGFNRRYAPLLHRLRDFVGREGRRWLTCRVNVGDIGDHWSNDPEEGGRLVSEGVHFFDLANWMHGVYPDSVTAMSLGSPELSNPNMTVLLSYPGGGMAQITYVTCGSKDMPKEYFELFGNGRSAALDDFKRLHCYGDASSKRASRRERNDKGQQSQMVAFLDAVTGNAAELAQRPGLFDGLMATATAHAAYESARTKNAVFVQEFLATHGIKAGTRDRG